MRCSASGKILPTMALPGGASATHGSDACTSKNTAPVRRTARSTSDNASIDTLRGRLSILAGRQGNCHAIRTIGNDAWTPGHFRRPHRSLDSKRSILQGAKTMANILNGAIDQQPAQTAVAPDHEAIKSRQRATWASGDYGIVGTTLQIVGESLCEAVDLRARSKVLDVAAGNGNCSLAAARRYCDVTSTDYVRSLLEDGRRRAEAERLSIRFQEADAEK